MIKLIFLAVVLYGVYFIFFRKPNIAKKNSEIEDTQTVIECDKCGVYISSEEIINKNNKHYCSDECARLS